MTEAGPVDLIDNEADDMDDVLPPPPEGEPSCLPPTLHPSGSERLIKAGLSYRF